MAINVRESKIISPAGIIASLLKARIAGIAGGFPVRRSRVVQVAIRKKAG